MIGGHVVDYTEHTKYSSNLKDVSVRLIILIDINNGLGIMARYIGKSFCTAPCTKHIWSCCGEEFGPRCVTLVVLNRDLYVLKTASNSFQK